MGIQAFRKKLKATRCNFPFEGGSGFQRVLALAFCESECHAPATGLLECSGLWMRSDSWQGRSSPCLQFPRTRGEPYQTLEMCGPDLCLWVPLAVPLCSRKDHKRVMKRRSTAADSCLLHVSGALVVHAVFCGSSTLRLGPGGGAAPAPAAAGTEGACHEREHEQGPAGECCPTEETQVPFLNLGSPYGKGGWAVSKAAGRAVCSLACTCGR